jgi:N-acetylmuramoyl-L-alanine amidase
MSIKLNVASGIAVAATLLTALVSAGGSGAQAEEAFPVVIPETPAIQAPAAPGDQALAATAAKPAPALTGQTFLPTTPAAPVGTTLAARVKAQSQQHGPLDSELRCLASAIYFEARGESLDGQLAVGRVVVGRANSGRFPASYCGVVFQPSQFSFVRGRTMPAVAEASAAWQRAVAVARIADEGSWQSQAEGALFFHATHVSPGWRKQRLARIDNHVFYR